MSYRPKPFAPYEPTVVGSCRYGPFVAVPYGRVPSQFASRPAVGFCVLCAGKPRASLIAPAVPDDSRSPRRSSAISATGGHVRRQQDQARRPLDRAVALHRDGRSDALDAGQQQLSDAASIIPEVRHLDPHDRLHWSRVHKSDKHPARSILSFWGSFGSGMQRGSGVVFGQRFATWEAAYPKTTPDPFRPTRIGSWSGLAKTGGIRICSRRQRMLIEPGSACGRMLRQLNRPRRCVRSSAARRSGRCPVTKMLRQSRSA